jgi:hypothetical protein
MMTPEYAAISGFIFPSYFLFFKATLWQILSLISRILILIAMKKLFNFASIIMLLCSSREISIAQILVADAGQNHVICWGGQYIQLGGSPTASGGTAPYHYQWMPSTSLNYDTIANPTANPTATTVYSVTVTDAALNTATSSVTISIDTLLYVNLSANQTICLGSCATISVLHTDTNVVIYSWNTGQTTDSIIVCPTTTTGYQVFVSNSNGCTASGYVTITVNPTLVANAGSNQTICYGNCVTLNASGGIAYAWSPSSMLSSTSIANPIACPTTTTTYTVTVSDGICTATDDITIYVDPQLIVSATSTNANCGQANGTISVTVTGGTAPFLYNGATNNLPAGNYTVTVTDANGCTASASAVVTDIPGPTLSISGTSSASCGLSNGSAITNVNGGTPPYNFMWNSTPTQNTPNLLNVPAGTYCVTVTDATACTADNCVTIGQIPGPTAAFTLVADTAILHHYYVVNNSSGIAPLKYLWSWDDSTQDTTAYPSHTYSAAGFYTICLSVTDSIGSACTNTYCDSSYLQKDPNAIISVEVIPQGTLGINEIESFNKILIYPNPFHNAFTIGMPANASYPCKVKISNSLTNIVITKEITQPIVSISCPDLSSGIYYITVEDKNGKIVGKGKLISQ